LAELETSANNQTVLEPTVAGNRGADEDDHARLKVSVQKLIMILKAWAPYFPRKLFKSTRRF
jgi:hypothetical protein